MPEKQCPQCGTELIYRKGIKKETGKPWQGYFCQNKQCKYVNWIRTNAGSEQKQFNPTPYQSQPSGADKIIGDIKKLQESMNAQYNLLQSIYKIIEINKSNDNRTNNNAGEGTDASTGGETNHPKSL